MMPKAKLSMNQFILATKIKQILSKSKEGNRYASRHRLGLLFCISVLKKTRVI